MLLYMFNIVLKSMFLAAAVNAGFCSTKTWIAWMNNEILIGKYLIWAVWNLTLKLHIQKFLFFNFINRLVWHLFFSKMAFIFNFKSAAWAFIQRFIFQTRFAKDFLTLWTLHWIPLYVADAYADSTEKLVGGRLIILENIDWVNIHIFVFNLIVSPIVLDPNTRISLVYLFTICFNHLAQLMYLVCQITTILAQNIYAPLNIIYYPLILWRLVGPVFLIFLIKIKVS